MTRCTRTLRPVSPWMQANATELVPPAGDAELAADGVGGARRRTTAVVLVLGAEVVVEASGGRRQPRR